MSFIKIFIFFGLLFLVIKLYINKNNQKLFNKYKIDNKTYTMLFKEMSLSSDIKIYKILFDILMIVLGIYAILLSIFTCLFYLICLFTLFQISYDKIVLGFAQSTSILGQIIYFIANSQIFLIMLLTCVFITYILKYIIVNKKIIKKISL